MKEIVYLKGSWLWDIISSIPKLSFFKKKWYNVNWIFFTNFNKSYLDFLNILKDNWFIDNIFIVENNYVGVLKFLIRNFRKYDKVIIWWILTRKNFIFWKILWKKIETFIKDRNVNKSIIELENPWKKISELLLYNFNFFKFNKKIIKDKYIVFYPSIYWRTINIQYIEEILNEIINLGYKIVILWWEREKWFSEHIIRLWRGNFISYLWKHLNYDILANILHYSEFNVLHNWWIMWLWNIVNQNNVNINTNSYRVWQPPADNKTIFNFIPNYNKIWCLPCEWKCIFKDKFICKNDKIFLKIKNIIYNVKK